MRVIGLMNLRGPQCRCLHMSLLPFLWQPQDYYTAIGQKQTLFNCLFLEDVNCFLERSICFCDDYRACQMETLPGV